jgi:hypothetical protein
MRSTINLTTSTTRTSFPFLWLPAPPCPWLPFLTSLSHRYSYNNKDRPAAENALRNIEDGINQEGQVGNQLAEQMTDPNQKRGLLKALNNLEKVGVPLCLLLSRFPSALPTLLPAPTRTSLLAPWTMPARPTAPWLPLLCRRMIVCLEQRETSIR